MKLLTRTNLIFFILICAFICQGSNQNQSSSYWPTNEWRISTPERQGMDSDQLAKLFDFVEENEINIHSLLIVRKGYVVLEAYFFPNSNGIIHDLASVTKSITSTLIGIALDKGHIKSVNQSVLNFFPDRKIENLDDNKKTLTIEHLLTMTTGFCRDFNHGERQLEQMRQSDDWVQFMLDQPILTRPGETFAYCSGASQILSAIISEATGMSALEFARQHLFEPLGIEDVIWPVDPQGNNTGWGDLFMHSRDMAKIGYLFLNEGEWKSKQIISADWIKRATKKHVAFEDGGGYGYRWWIHGELPGLYEARGRGGQRICIWPEKDIVVVFTGNGFEPGDIGQFIIVSDRTDISLPENPDGFKLMQKKITEASKAPASKPVPDLPLTARKISGKTYIFDPNNLGFISFSLSFEKKNEASLRLIDDDQEETNSIGLDGVYRFSPNSRFGLPEALRGYWESEREFYLEYNEFAGNHLYRIWFCFEENSARMRIIENTGLLNTTIKAKEKH